MAVAFRSATSATNLTPAEPAGVAQDDILLAVYSSETPATVPTAATGWTEIFRDQDAGPSGVIAHASYWIRRGATAVANNWGGAADGRVCLLAYSGCVTTGSPLNVTGYTEGTDTTADGSLTTTVNDCMIVGLMNQWSWSATSSVTWANERIDQAEAVSCYDDGLLATAGATGTLTITCGAVWGLTMVALAPAAGGPAFVAGDPIIVGQGAALTRSTRW